MKIKTQYVLLSIIPLLASCASRPVALAPVGPNPFVGSSASAGTGFLRVFSERERITEGSYEGANPSFYQHTAYRIYDTKGRLVKHVGNTIGHYESTPGRFRCRPETTSLMPKQRTTSRSRCRCSLRAGEPPASTWMTAGHRQPAHRRRRWSSNPMESRWGGKPAQVSSTLRRRVQRSVPVWKFSTERCNRYSYWVLA